MKVTRLARPIRRGLGLVLGSPGGRAVVAVGAVLYLLLYLVSVDQLVYSPDGLLLPAGDPPLLRVAPDWTARLLRARASLVWEPVLAVYLTGRWALFVAVPNLVLGAAIGTLVGMNLALALLAAVAGGVRRGSRPLLGVWQGLAGGAPALLTGFACCAPTALIALGSMGAGVTAGFLAVRPVLMPLTGMLLVSALAWSAYRVGAAVPPPASAGRAP